MTVSDASVRLAQAEARVRRLEAAADAASRAAGSIMGDDPAVVSGIRRKANGRADARRHATYDREAEAHQALRTARADLAAAERKVQDEADAAAVDLSMLAPGCLIRTKWGWREVATVNKVSVSIVTDESWSTLVRFGKILEVRPSPAACAAAMDVHPAGRP